MFKSRLENVRHVSWFGIALVTCCVAAGCTLVIWYGLDNVLKSKDDVVKLGQFADFFGGLMNPVVALCALIGIWYSVSLQKKELAKLSKGQEEQGMQQRFFDLLRLYQQTLDSIVVIDTVHQQGSVLTSGKAAMNLFLNGEALRFRFAKYAIKEGFNDGRLKMVSEEWSQAGDWMSHYFRIVFMFLNEAQVNFDEHHEKYVKLFCAQLSRDEVRFIALYLLFDPDGVNARNIAKQYSLLHYLSQDRLREYAQQQLPTLFQ